MTPGWWIVVLVGAITISFKAFGPVVLGGRELTPLIRRLSNGVPAAVLAALVTVQTLTSDGTVTVDARLAGVLAAACLLVWKRPLWVALAAAAAVTAAVRWVT